MLLGAIAGAEMAMRDVGIEVELGSGVAAAQATFADGVTATKTRIAAE
jgi:alanine-glyoxylate transaminase/serine-glyoxylate transaminase/serine-pyruvate transaminase